MVKRSQVKLWALIPVLFGCWSRATVSEHYRVSPPKNGWNKTLGGGADHSWYHKENGGLMFVNSNCGRRFEDRPLKDSLNSLLAGITVGESITSQELKIDNRAAHMEIYDAKIDGIEMQIAAIVLSKNECLYDFVYTAPKQDFRAELESFIGMTHSFKLRQISLQDGDNK